MGKRVQVEWFSLKGLTYMTDDYFSHAFAKAAKCSMRLCVYNVGLWNPV